jgi:hypothetical protein
VSHVILALGLVLAVEGLVLALAPRRIEDALRLIASLGLDQRPGDRADRPGFGGGAGLACA